MAGYSLTIRLRRGQVQVHRRPHYIWNNADDVRREAWGRATYRDVSLPMTVRRGPGAAVEPVKQAVPSMKAARHKARAANQEDASRSAAGPACYSKRQAAAEACLA